MNREPNEIVASLKMDARALALSAFEAGFKAASEAGLSFEIARRYFIEQVLGGHRD